MSKSDVLRVVVTFEVPGITDPDGEEADKIVEELTELTSGIARDGLSITGKDVYVSAWVDYAHTVHLDEEE